MKKLFLLAEGVCIVDAFAVLVLYCVCGLHLSAVFQA